MKKYKITVPQAAKIMGKNQELIRSQIESGKLNFGTVEYGKTGKRIFYISPPLFIQYTGVSQQVLEEITGQDCSEFYQYKREATFANNTYS